MKGCMFLVFVFLSVSFGWVQAEELSVKQLMKDNIDVHAQYSLRRMSKEPGENSIVANEIYSAIVEDQLGGIYIVNQREPAMRAKSMGTWWGEIIPKGKKSFCMHDPKNNKPPIIVFKDEIRSKRDVLDEEIRGAWGSCFSSSEPTCEQDYSLLGATVELMEHNVCSSADGATLSLWQNHKDHWSLMLGAASRIPCAIWEPDRHGGCDKIGPTMYDTGEDIVNHIFETQECNKKIKFLHVFGHSYYKGLIGTKGDMTGLYRNLDKKQSSINRGKGGRNISDIPLNAIHKDAIVLFHGCNTADGEEKDNFAKDFYEHFQASHPGIKVYGHNTSVTVGKEGHTWREYSARSPKGEVVLKRNPYYVGHHGPVPKKPHP